MTNTIFWTIYAFVSFVISIIATKYFDDTNLGLMALLFWPVMIPITIVLVFYEWVRLL